MRLLVFGQTGQVATEIGRLAPEARLSDGSPEARLSDGSPEAWVRDGAPKARFLGRDAVDLADPEAVAWAVAEAEADAVINAAAWTAVDAAEANPEAAFAVNAAGPAAMARACAARGLPLVHLSTDYVFDGTGERPWRPGDPTGPLGAYGASKLAGEEGVRAANGPHAILRTSWVFSAHGSNFVKTMLRLGRERGSLRVVADQVGGPTPADSIAAACLQITKVLVRDPGRGGTYHFSGAPDVAWAEFARAIFARAGLHVAVEDIASEDYPTPAPRPRNSRLDCGATETAFGLGRPDWRAGLDRVLATLSG